MNELQIFKDEAFGEIRTLSINNEPWFVGKDVAEALGYKDTINAIKSHIDIEDKKRWQITTPSGGQSAVIINESGLYSLVLSSKLPAAKQFKRWITSEVLPTIRKTGGYVNNEELFLNTYLPFADAQTRGLFQTTLLTIRNQNELIKQQQQEITYKENVIIGLVEDIDLAEKRQRINQIIRHNTKDFNNVSKKWNLLYSEFEKKYHVNLYARLTNYRDEFKPKLKNQLDVIDRQMNMIPQLYEVCCKLFENDVKMLMKEWESTITN